MLESAREVGGQPPSLGGMLLEGKVAVRSPRSGGVSRRALVNRARTTGERIVGVTAPAGYGKTTLLTQWAAMEDRPVAWATLDRFDDDPATLLTLIATACAALSPAVADVVPEMNGLGTAILGRSAPLLAATLSRVPHPFVLMIDDLHSASSLECHDALEILLGGVPDGSQAVLASRHAQPYFARLRVEVPLLEITADDLRLDADGAQTIFADADVAISHSDAAQAAERCEGWPAGLYLCALAVRAGGEMPAIFGDDRFVADYLYRECLAALPADRQRFLRRTAILEQLSAELCDATLDARGSGEMLRYFESLNLFLLPMDRRGRWFRYHALFREFLLADLQQHEAELLPELHGRAADWLEQHDLRDLTVEHLLAAGRLDRAGRLVADLALPAYQRGEVAVVDRWLDELGESAIAGSPGLAVIAAWVAILQGKSPDAERWAAQLDRIDTEGAPEENLIAFESARAMVRAAMCPRGWQDALDDARLAVASEPLWSPWRDQALHLLGSALLLADDRAGARTAFEESSAVAAQAGNADSILLSEAELAILAIDAGDAAAAENHAHAAASAIEEHHMEGYPTTALALAVNARLAMRRGDARATDQFLARAMRARVHCTHVLPYLAMRTRLQIAFVFVGLGDRAAALHILREIDDLRSRCPDVGALAEEIERFRHRVLDAEVSTASIPLTPAEMRLLPYLQTHLTIAEIGERLYISRNTVSTEVGSIYRKLGVTTRSAAVKRAVESGLLGG